MESVQQQYMDMDLIDEVAVSCKYCLLLNRQQQIDQDILQFVTDLLNSIFQMVSLEDLIMCNPLKVADFLYFSLFITTFKVPLDFTIANQEISRLMKSTVITKNEWMPDDEEELKFLFKDNFVPKKEEFFLPKDLALFNSRNYEQLTHRIIQYKNISDNDLITLLSKAVLDKDMELGLLLLLMFNPKSLAYGQVISNSLLDSIVDDKTLSQLLGKALLL